MTTHDNAKIVCMAKEAGIVHSTWDKQDENAVCNFYAIAFEDGRQSVDTPVALAEAYRCGEEAGRQAEREEIVKDLLPPIATPQTKAHYIANEIADSLCKAIRARSTK